MPTIRLFRNQNSSNPNAVIVGVPDEVQLDTNTSQIQFTQVEVLPEPTTINDLFLEPMVINNSATSANLNIVTTQLQPGFTLNAVPMSNVAGTTVAFETEEVNIPIGYILLDDLPQWPTQNYNDQYQKIHQLNALPGRIPVVPNFEVYRADRKFSCTHNACIDEIKVYYRRRSATNANPWAYEGYINKESTLVFELEGEYDFRFVPFFDGKPVGSINYKEKIVEWKKNTNLKWTSIQLSPNRHRIEFSGHIGTDINLVEVYQKTTRNRQQPYSFVASFELIPDSSGKLSRSNFEVEVSNTENYPCLEYRFYKLGPVGSRRPKVYISKAEHNLKKHYNSTDISLNVDSLDKSIFRINIGGALHKLFKPTQPGRWREQKSEWEDVAIPQGLLMLRLSIRRHQSGVVTDYGTYIINHTHEGAFIQSVPFHMEGKPQEDVYSFIFEDSEDFRSVRNLPSPDFSENSDLSYEFRLLSWSAGIEESVITNTEKVILKRNFGIDTDGKSISRDYAYNCWSFEHPKRLYRNIQPPLFSQDNLKSYLRFASMKTGWLIPTQTRRPQHTRNVEIVSGEWKVLYYCNNDEIQEFPYYCFDINIPYSSRQTIDFIEVMVSNPDMSTPITIGKFHACENIEIIDFMGYFKVLEHVTNSLNINEVISNSGQETTSVAGNSSSYALSVATAGLNSTMTSPVGSSFSMTPNMGSEWNSNNSLPFAGMSTINSVNSGTSLSISTIPTDTASQNLESMNSVRALNNAIAVQAESGIVNYVIKATYLDESVELFDHSVDISSRPKLPPDPAGNSSVVPGNAILNAQTYQISAQSSQQLIQAIGTINVASSAQAISTNTLASTTINTVSFGDY